MKISRLEDKILFFAYNQYDSHGEPAYEMNTAFFAKKFGVSPDKTSQALLNLYEMEYIIATSRGVENIGIHTITSSGKKYCKEQKLNINVVLKHPVTSAIISAAVAALISA